MNARALATCCACALGWTAGPALAASGSGGSAGAALAGALLLVGASLGLLRRGAAQARRRGDDGHAAPAGDGGSANGAPARRDAAGDAGPQRATQVAASGLQVLSAHCCLAGADTVAELRAGSASGRALARPDRSLLDDDGFPVLSVRIAALDAAEADGPPASAETRRALAALDRALADGAAGPAGAAAPATAIVGLPPSTSATDRAAAAAWLGGRLGPSVEVVALDAPALWRLAAARCAAAPGRAVLLAAAGSEIGPDALARRAAAAQLHGAAAPVGLVPGEGAVALRLCAPPVTAADGSARLVPLGTAPGDDTRPVLAAGEADDGAPASPVADAVGALRAALAATGASADELGGWFTDLQPQRPETTELLAAAADIGLLAQPASLAVGRCASPGAVGALACVALAVAHARSTGRTTLALAVAAPLAALSAAPSAFIVEPPPAGVRRGPPSPASGPLAGAPSAVAREHAR